MTESETKPDENALLDEDLDEDMLREKVKGYAAAEEKVQSFRDLFDRYPRNSTFVIYTRDGRKVKGKVGGVSFLYGYDDEDPYNGYVGDVEISLWPLFRKPILVRLNEMNKITVCRRFREYVVYQSD